MANTTTTVPMGDTREVVIEPTKPPQPRPKQYIAVTPLTYEKKSYKPGDQILIPESDAFPLLAARQITPLEVALREGIYPRSQENLTEKVVETVTGQEIPDTKAEAQVAAAAPKKSFLGNALRDAIQKKKAETNPGLAPTKIDSAKLAAIKAGGKK